MNEQGVRLRGLARRPNVRSPFSVAVTSGKGGVGKTTIAVNLALAVAHHDRRVLLWDADLSLSNADLLLGVTPGARIDDVLEGRARWTDALVPGPWGVTLLAASAGVAALTRLDPDRQARIVEGLAEVVGGYDLVVIDTGPGISEGVTTLAAAADLALVVLTPEPAALADAYAVVKILARERPQKVAVCPNRYPDVNAALAGSRRFQALTRRFLGVEPPVFGCVTRDSMLERSVLELDPLLLTAPGSPAARGLWAMARKLLSMATPNGDGRGLIARLQARTTEPR
jgi:flagellar biosynthesis protein FlhG